LRAGLRFFSVGKSFLAGAVHRSLLFPPSLHDWLPERRLARFLVAVVSALDLGPVHATAKKAM
jgi:hypothetical protein